jgi:adenylate cyclase
MTLDRTQKVLAQDPSTGSALGFGATALAALGDRERTREWVKRAMLMDPENITMRWNLACALSRYLEDVDGAIELLAGFVDKAPPPLVKYLRLDPDLDPLRPDPRFEALVSNAEQSLAARQATPSQAAAGAN